MTLAEYATEHGLHRVGARPNLVQYLKQAWSRRDFAIAMARFRIQANQERNRLGMLVETHSWKEYPVHVRITRNTVVSVLQKGYLISERVLRPALVTVTAPK